MSSKRKKEWLEFERKNAKKRTGKRDDAAVPSDFITVQRLSSNVEGKCQKYSRIGPLTMVPLGKEATLDNIKEACKAHFGTRMECDLLAGERGPSYTDAAQIKNWKVIHIRFIENVNADNNRSVPRSVRLTQSSPVSPEKANPLEVASTAVAASVPLSQMLKLGRLILPKVDIVSLYLEEFSIVQRQWLQPIEVKLSLHKSSFASGAFREAYEANAISGLPPGKYVLKRYKENRIKEIEQFFQSTEAHTRKAVQMNALARNFTQSMELEKPALEFGRSFTYTKVFFSALNGEFVTVEKYLDGTFRKYVNNTGEVCGDSSDEVTVKAEAFAHYTYVRSDKQLMVLDIQGIDYNLCDPEIASTNLTDKTDNSILFCSGNLSANAIDKFFEEHSCNKYCRLLGISE